MIFQTQAEIAPLEKPLSYTDKLFLVGSCFAVNMHVKLAENKLQSSANPFGPLYNPLSVCRSLLRLEQCRPYTADDLLCREGLFFSYDFHTSVCHSDPEEVLKVMNKAITDGHKALSECDALIITLGTSFAYTLKESGTVVNNCNKMPSRLFDRQMLSPEQTSHEMMTLLSRPLYKDKLIILTVSPIRHLSDGLADNCRSKAHLITAAGTIVDRLPHAVYFPAYEIMNDQLRDYRFYADDMIHPSAVAIEYIWERFFDTAFDRQAHDYVHEMSHIRRAVMHRPFNPLSASYGKFAATMLEKAYELKKRYPQAPLDDEITFFLKSLDRINE